METYGATVRASPSDETDAGRAILASDPDSPGQPGHRHLRSGRGRGHSREDTKYALGSVLNHVLLHQTVIGLEAMKQMEMADDYPDVVIGCAGGGSQFRRASRSRSSATQLQRRAERCASSRSSRRPAQR